MNTETEKCPVCHSDNASVQRVIGRNAVFCVCPVCGCFELDQDITENRNMNHLASYLFYNAFHERTDSASRFHTELSEEHCAEIREKHRKNKALRLPYHMDAQIIENWYPKTFSEKIDKIMLYLEDHEKHFGEVHRMFFAEWVLLFFVDLHDIDSDGRCQWRNPINCYTEARKVLKYLRDERYISFTEDMDRVVELSIEPNGYKRIDELQRNKSAWNNALIAMKFGDETKAVREAIRKGVIAAGYNPIIYDEVENNDYIMPELLKSIRDSKFVVADLSDHNNGAYFEEGYAMGIGKPVIQLCRKGVELHFDAAQKNTIVWETESELSDRLTNRIKATID